jgi:hypothetical protein
MSPDRQFAATVPQAADAASSADARVRLCLLGAAFLGLVAVSSLPAARAVGAFGWMPLWLIGMPLTSLLVMSMLRRHHRPDSSPDRLAARRAGASAARRLPSARPGMAGPRLASPVPRRARIRAAALPLRGHAPRG